MAQSLSKNELGNGLPLCLSSLLKLQKPLYLSGQRRHRVLQGVWVRSRIGDELQAETDEAVLLAFYSDPRNRRELWDHWRANPPPAASVRNRRKGGRPEDEPPPSLEYCILDDLDRSLLQSEGSDDVLIDRLREEVDSRLNRWSDADNAERRQTVCLAFALASLRNDGSVLQQAIERVEKLAEEFEELLRSPAADPSPVRDADSEAPGAAPTELVPPAGSSAPNRELLRGLQQAETKIDSAFSSVQGLVEKIEDSESLEIFGGFATSVEDRVQALQGGLTARRQRLKSRRTIEELQSAAASFLDEIARNDAATGIRGDLDELADRWSDLSQAHSREATAELARLQSEVRKAIETLEQTHNDYGKLEEQRTDLRGRKPTSREEQRDLDERLDALHDQSVAARNRHRAAEDALLAALAPSDAVQDDREVQQTDAEVPTQADGKNPTPPVAKAENDPADTELPAVETEKERKAEPAQTPAQPDQPVPREEPAEFDDSKIRKSPAPSAAEAETVVPAGAVGEEPADSASPLEEPRPTPAPATPEPPKSQAWNERERGVRKALAEALADEPPRLAEAFQICRLAEDLEIVAGQPGSAIVEAALYASHLRRAHGELAADLREVIENAPSEAPPGSTPAQVNAEALLRFAGAVVPTLLAPHTGAAAWLQGLTHEGLLALYDFSHQAAERGWAAQTAGIDAGSFLRRAGRHLKQGDAMAALRRDLASWREGDATLPLGYVPAKKVWSALLREGPLDRLLKGVSNGANADQVRTDLAKIEDRDSLRKRLDDLSARLLNRRQSIDQKIFRKIRRRLDRPCELARKYLDLLDATTDHASHHQEVLSNFVRLIQNDAPGLHQELQTVKARQDEDPLVRAAANAASCALTQVQQLVDLESRAAATDEPTTDTVRASGLFRYPQIRIADSGLADGNPEEDLWALSSAPVPDLTTALETRIEAADLLTAQRILDWPASTEQMSEEDSERWRERLDSSREDRLHSLKEDAETLRDALESAYLYGQLAPDDRLETDLRLSALEQRIEDRKVVHFDRSVAELDSLRRELERAKDGSLQALRSEAQSRLAAAEPDRLREIERHISDGDLVAANELLFRASEPRTRTIEDLTGPGDLLDTYLAADRGELRAATKDWSALVEAAKEGGHQGALAFDQLDEDDRVSAADLLESWGDLRTCSRLNRASVAKVSRELFSRLGFTDVRVKFDRNVSGVRRGMWTGELLADTLANRDECAIAQFGSLARGRYRLLVCFDAPTPTQVGQELGGAYSGQAAIVVCTAPLSDGIREQLTRTSFEKKLPFVVLDQSLLAFLAMQASPRRSSLFALSLPFSYCKAFQTRSSFVPPEMFFGRDRERSEVSNFDEGSCFLYGGRQLGKTALLRRVQEEFTSPERGQFAVWIDLKDGGIGDADTADVWAVIWKHLQELGAIEESAQRPTREPRSVETFCEALHSRFNPKTRGRLLILLDEADNFLRRDALNSDRATFAESSRLKALMERNRSIKVVFAGLHNVLRTTNQSNHPLAHLGTPICIGPFIRREERQEAEDLISVPLRACGYRFDPRRLTRSVLARANYYPSLLQIYGNAIADRLSAPARRRSPNELPTVHADLLDSIHRDRTFQDEIRKRFVWTLELDPRYEAIAYVLAYMCHEDDRVLRDGTGVARLFDEARAWWEAGFGDGYDAEQFKALLEEMVELGVLRLTDQPGSEEPNFSLRNPNVLALLGNAQALEAKLLALEERPAIPELGPREIRRRDNEKGPLHRPLTLRQEHEIEGRSEKGTGRNEVVLVCGTEAAGARHVLDFLTAGKGISEVERLKTPRSRAGFERDLRSRLRARKPGTMVLLCDATAQTWREDWLDAAQGSLETLRSRDRLARVVFALDADRLMAHRRTIIEREGRGALRLVELKPWSLDFAARCLDDDQDVGHRLDPKQERELADLAGGWPVLLDLVVQALRNGGRPERLTSKAGFRELLLEHAAGLREAFALEHADLAAVLRLARELGTATDEELLDPEARELAACPLGDSELRSAIWAAGKLHLLQAIGPAEWRVDPIVAKILQTLPG